jgi:hypothetical protein
LDEPTSASDQTSNAHQDRLKFLFTWFLAFRLKVQPHATHTELVHLVQLLFSDACWIKCNHCPALWAEVLHRVDDRSVVVSIDRDRDRTEVLDVHALLELEQRLGGGLSGAIHGIFTEWKSVLNRSLAVPWRG